MSNTYRELQILGIKVCRGAPLIHHLLFVDDSVIFCKAVVEINRKIQKLLLEYEKALRQCINIDKTAMVFSRNTNTNT